MNDRLVETWTTRDLPVLRRILERFDAGDDLVDLQDLHTELAAMSSTQLRTALRALEDAGYIDVSFTMGGPDRVTGHVNRVRERARRELGTWPTPDLLVDELAAALSRAADESPEPERENRLRAAADALYGFGRDIAVAVVARHVGG